MNLLPMFMRETYVVKPDSRIPVKEIYEDFRAWVIAKSGVIIWNTVSQKQVYTALKENPLYTYVRFREGYCLKGITYKPKNEVEDIKEEISPTLTLKVIPAEQQWKGPPRITQMVLPKAFQNS